MPLRRLCSSTFYLHWIQYKHCAQIIDKQPSDACLFGATFGHLCYTGYTFVSPVLHRVHLYVTCATQVTPLCHLCYADYTFMSPVLHRLHLCVTCATQVTLGCAKGTRFCSKVQWKNRFGNSRKRINM